jgi:hypothetical protein
LFGKFVDLLCLASLSVYFVWQACRSTLFGKFVDLLCLASL